MVWSEGLSSRSVPGEEGLGGVDDHHGEDREGGNEEWDHTINYATNPRSVGAVVEKS